MLTLTITLILTLTIITTLMLLSRTIAGTILPNYIILNLSTAYRVRTRTGYILTTGPVYDATQPSRTNQLTLSRRRHPDLAILSNHSIDRKVRANSQEEVTPQKAFFPDANNI